ncbi:hypothetical protein T08_8026, partial [Trichinella sp. T8]
CGRIVERTDFPAFEKTNYTVHKYRRRNRDFALIFGPPSRIIVNFGITSKIVEASDLRIVNTMASAAKVRCKKLAANKDRLNQLLAELEELCLESAD